MLINVKRLNKICRFIFWVYICATFNNKEIMKAKFEIIAEANKMIELGSTMTLDQMISFLTSRYAKAAKKQVKSKFVKPVNKAVLTIEQILMSINNAGGYSFRANIGYNAWIILMEYFTQKGSISEVNHINNITNSKSVCTSTVQKFTAFISNNESLKSEILNLNNY